VLLQLRLQKGQTYRQRVTSQQTISQTLFDTAMVMTQTIGMGYAYEVEDVDARGNMQIRATYDWILYRVEIPSVGVIEYDSSDPSAQPPPGAEAFAALIGEGFQVRIAPDGEILEVDGVEEMLENILDKLPPAQRESLEEALRQQFSSDALKDEMGKSFVIYPDKPVGVGDSWKEKQVTGIGTLPITLDTTWTLKMRRGGRSTVEVTSLIETIPGMPAEQGSTGAIYRLVGEQRGTIEIDESTGWIIRGIVTQHLSGEVQMGDPSQPVGSTSWTMSLESTTTIETPGD